MTPLRLLVTVMLVSTIATGSLTGAPATAATDQTARPTSSVNAADDTDSTGVVAADGGPAGRFPYVAGLAQVAKHYPVAGARVLAETMRGKPLHLAWGHGAALRRTQASGAFLLPRRGLPRHFVVKIRGGRIHGRKTKGVFRAVVSRSPRGEVAEVSLGTTVQTNVYRSMRGKRSYSAHVLRRAHNRTLHTVRLPRYLVLGWDDRVNPRFIRGKRLQHYAKRFGGYGALARRVEWLARHDKTIPLSTPIGGEPGGSTRVKGADVVEDCADATFDFTPKALAECVASGALAIVSSAFGPAPSSQVLQDLQDVTVDLADLSQQLSNLQADINTDFLDLVADQAQDEYNAAARELLPTTSDIQAQLTSLSQLAANVPGKAPAIVVEQQVTALVDQLDPDTPGSVLSPSTATELADGTVADGASGLGTLPAAWQAIRAQQQTGSLGATTDGDAALGQGTTLFTNEMSTAFASPAAYWFDQLWLLGVLTSNYYNYLYTQDGLAPNQVVAETADILGGFSASGTCPGSTSSAQPVACPGSISANLMQQVTTTPLIVPPGTVVDPTTDLVWGSAFTTDVTGTTTGSGLPTDPTTGNSMVPELITQVNAGATTPWPGVNPNVLALSARGVADQQGNYSWSIPTVNYFLSGTPWSDDQWGEYDAGSSPQFGSLGGGAGLLGGLGSGNNPDNLGGITDPPAFPAELTMWANSNFWAFNVSLGNGWLPSGIVQYQSACNGSVEPPFPGACGSSGGNPPQYPPNAVAAPVVLNAPIPGAYFQYPAAYPPAVLADLPYQLSLFR